MWKRASYQPPKKKQYKEPNKFGNTLRSPAGGVYGQDVIEKCRKLYEQGASLLECTQHCRVSRATVQRWANHNEWRKGHDNRFHSAAMRAHCDWLRKKRHYNLSEIERQTGVASRTLKRWGL